MAREVGLMGIMLYRCPSKSPKALEQCTSGPG
jgi:hypothetical protein